MIVSPNILDDAAVCAMCGGYLGARRYAQMESAALFIFCSEECVRAAMREQGAKRWAARRRYARRVAIAAILIGAWLTPHQRPERIERPPPAPAVMRDAPPPLPPGWYGPEWPPTEMSLLAALGRDTWVHPLAGPFRRMPRTDARVFGAVRPGLRAVECRNGHCGVDLGGEIWGEHVHAAHDGVVDWVQRGPNPDHGGSFVRISHRNGTVFTQYFHLAAIPRGLERGVPVKGGDVIGLLGDSGVKESAPHLHFTISVRPAKERPEKYMDPEPLIALWPLRVPIKGGEVGLVTTLGDPGVPLGSAPPRQAQKRRPTKQRPAPDESAQDESGESGRTARDVPPETESAPETGEPGSSTEGE